MTARVFATILFLVAGLSAPALRAGDWTHTAPQWRVIGRGLNFAEVKVLEHGEAVESLAVVKIDPASNGFRVYHHAPQSITAWQQETKDPVIFNASYYGAGAKPVGLVLLDGKPLGPLHNPQMRGMFVAEPKGLSPDLPRATILDLAANPVNPLKLPWTQGVQSFPLLLDYKGQIRVRNSEKRSHRTVIAADRVGNILVFNTASAYFTLHDLAQFLKTSGFDIDSALNLDGGTEAQLFIKTKDFEYISPPSWEARLGNLMDRKEFWLPTVVGVFPRGD